MPRQHGVRHEVLRVLPRQEQGVRLQTPRQLLSGLPRPLTSHTIPVWCLYLLNRSDTHIKEGDGMGMFVKDNP